PQPVERRRDLVAPVGWRQRLNLLPQIVARRDETVVVNQELIQERLLVPDVLPDSVLSRYRHAPNPRLKVAEALLDPRHLPNRGHPLGRRIWFLAGRRRNKAAMVGRSERAHRGRRLGQSLGRLLSNEQIVGASPILAFVEIVAVPGQQVRE